MFLGAWFSECAASYGVATKELEPSYRNMSYN